jgi:hypothetical protein
VWSKDHALSYLTTHKLHHTKLPLYAAALSHELASATLDCLPFVPGFKARMDLFNKLVRDVKKAKKAQ